MYLTPSFGPIPSVTVEYFGNSENWELIDDEDGWMKLRHYKSSLVLQSSKDGKKLTVGKNQLPCHGNKPCLRYVYKCYSEPKKGIHPLRDHP